MKYTKEEAHKYANEHVLKGVWAAITTPFNRDLEVDYEGFRHNMRHYVDVLHLNGLFLNGLQGEGFNLTVEERKKVTEIAVEEANGKLFVMPQTGGNVFKETVELTKHAEACGADFVILINPKYYSGSWTGEGVYQYYKAICDSVNIGILMFNQMLAGYLTDPKTISRLADLPNFVGIKHTGPPGDVQATRWECDKKLAIAAGEGEPWLSSLAINGVEAMIPGPSQYSLQSKKSQLINEYVHMAEKGELAKAWATCAKVNPLRKLYASVNNPTKGQSCLKYWCQFLGMAGGDGRVRLPMLDVTAEEKKAIKKAVESTELV